MEIFKQLKNLGYKHYIDLTIEELEALPIDNVEKRIEYSLVIDWFREKYNMNVVIQNTYYGRKDETFKVAYFFFIEGGTPNNLVYDYQDLYNDVLDASERVNLGDHINEELYDKNIFEIGFAYKTYEECREKAILKCIELCKQ